MHNYDQQDVNVRRDKRLFAAKNNTNPTVNLVLNFNDVAIDYQFRNLVSMICTIVNDVLVSVVLLLMLIPHSKLREVLLLCIILRVIAILCATLAAAIDTNNYIIFNLDPYAKDSIVAWYLWTKWAGIGFSFIALVLALSRYCTIRRDRNSSSSSCASSPRYPKMKCRSPTYCPPPRQRSPRPRRSPSPRCQEPYRPKSPRPSRIPAQVACDYPSAPTLTHRRNTRQDSFFQRIQQTLSQDSGRTIMDV